MSIAAVMFKHPAVAGLRVFQNIQAAENAGENPAALVAAGGLLIKWPGSLGAPPNDATVATWQAELDAAVLGKDARQTAIKANAESDTFIDKLRDATPAQINTFVQNNVTDLASARIFIAKLANAVAFALQGGTDK